MGGGESGQGATRESCQEDGHEEDGGVTEKRPRKLQNLPTPGAPPWSKGCKLKGMNENTEQQLLELLSRIAMALEAIAQAHNKTFQPVGGIHTRSGIKPKR
jgi:hypothetical protein